MLGTATSEYASFQLKFSERSSSTSLVNRTLLLYMCMYISGTYRFVVRKRIKPTVLLSFRVNTNISHLFKQEKKTSEELLERLNEVKSELTETMEKHNIYKVGLQIRLIVSYKLVRNEFTLQLNPMRF